MWTSLYWIDGPWKGKLALSGRPRGGDWLKDETAPTPSPRLPKKYFNTCKLVIAFSLLTIYQ